MRLKKYEITAQEIRRKTLIQEDADTFYDIFDKIEKNDFTVLTILNISITGSKLFAVKLILVEYFKNLGYNTKTYGSILTLSLY